MQCSLVQLLPTLPYPNSPNTSPQHPQNSEMASGIVGQFQRVRSSVQACLQFMLIFVLLICIKMRVLQSAVQLHCIAINAISLASQFASSFCEVSRLCSLCILFSSNRIAKRALPFIINLNMQLFVLIDGVFSFVKRFGQKAVHTISWTQSVIARVPFVCTTVQFIFSCAICSVKAVCYGLDASLMMMVL